MKKLFSIVLVIALSITTVFAQSPEMFKYQTIVRNNDGEIVKSQAVAFRISIVPEIAAGASIYTETHSKTTNDFGLVNLEIGAGNVTTGSFSTINWGNGTYFVRIEIDIANGTNFVEMGTTQLLSVPYALHSKTAQHYSETDPSFSNSPASIVTQNNISEWNNAFGWGNHAGLYKPIYYTPSWYEIWDKPYFANISYTGDYNDLYNTPTGNNFGDMQYWNGYSWTLIPKGSTGQILTMNSEGIPEWSSFPYVAMPQVITLSASIEDSTTVMLRGTVNAQGTICTVSFEYGETSAYGQTIDATPNTVTGNSITTVSSTITELTTGTIYHYRAKIEYANGVLYGADKIVKPVSGIQDFDGNLYTSVEIGTQTWLRENLKAIHYQNGDPIPNVTDGYEWTQQTTGAYSWSDNDSVSNAQTYGALYNWYAVNDERLICPAGWHVASADEYSTLFNFLGGEYIAGGKMKEAGTEHWSSPNTEATNESEFTGLPGGHFHGENGAYYYLGLHGYWWSSTPHNETHAMRLTLGYNSGSAGLWPIMYQYGFSVRCIKDSVTK